MNRKTRPDYKFFISYRRGDNQDFVEHIRSWFAWHYGPDNVFMDFTSIKPGTPFPKKLREEIQRCDALLAIIGPTWLSRILEDPFRDDDWVRIEIGEAIKKKKLVIPIYIKTPPDIEPSKLPPELRGLPILQGARFDSGQNLLDRIEDTMDSIDAQLATRALRKKNLMRMDEISPAPGIALGYYINFVRPVVNQLVILNDDARAEASGVKISVGETEIKMHHRPVKISLIIPPRIDLLKQESLEATRKILRQAAIHSPDFRRPFGLYAHESTHGYELIDFPTTITVLEYWLEKRLEREGGKSKERKAQKLEVEELRYFEESLKYWIEDQPDPFFRNCVQVKPFNPDDPEFRWLSELWGQ
jgi:hypothetical protein